MLDECTNILIMNAGASEWGEPSELPPDLAELPPGPELGQVLATIDPRRLTAHQLVILVQAQNRQVAYQQGQLLLALRELGYAPPGVRHEVVRRRERWSFAAVETAFAASWTTYRSELMLQLSEFAIDEAPALAEAMAVGRVDLDKVKMFHAELSGVTDRETLRGIIDDVLRYAARETAPMLRARIQRVLARRDPESTRRRRKRDHGARSVQRKNESDGLVSLTARFADPSAATAAYEHIDALARATKAAGDPSERTIDQLRHDIFLDLLAGGPGVCRMLHGGAGTGIGAETGQHRQESGRPGCLLCRAALTALVSEPGEIAGYGPVTAHLAREAALELANVSTWRYAIDADGAVIAEGALPKHLIPEMVEQMHRWSADASAGPDGRLRYKPTTAQIAFVRARDQRCQAPGCRVPAHRCDVDHRIPWQRGGPTFIDNLHCLCRTHHRAKDEAGFSYRRVSGGLEWVSACGYRYLRADDHNRRRRWRNRPSRRGHADEDRRYWSTPRGGVEVTVDERLFRHSTTASLTEQPVRRGRHGKPSKSSTQGKPRFRPRK